MKLLQKMEENVYVSLTGFKLCFNDFFQLNSNISYYMMRYMKTQQHLSITNSTILIHFKLVVKMMRVLLRALEVGELKHQKQL